MFDLLSKKLGNVFQSLKGKGLLKEADVNVAIEEIRIILLEADISLDLVKQIQGNIKEKALQQHVLQSISPGQQIIKIVHDSLLELLGSKASPLILAGDPAIILMIGLQGSGKTTSSAKLASFLEAKHNRKVMLASLDIYRPAAMTQLENLANTINVTFLSAQEGYQPLEIVSHAIQAAKLQHCNTLILDTAGRNQVDTALMTELKQIAEATKAKDIILVADAMAGQDAVRSAVGFAEAVNLNGLFFTRLDGDARGGAILSAKQITGQEVKFLGTGEKISDIEVFHPDRIVSQILGQGDVVSLVEKAQEHSDGQEEETMRRMVEGSFNLNDMSKQLSQIRKMGGITDMMRFLPGKLKQALPKNIDSIDRNSFKRQEAIISSMTEKERLHPKIIHANRRKRIANGSGTKVSDVNKLLKQFQSMGTMMKMMKKQGMGGFDPSTILQGGLAGRGRNRLY